MDCMKSLWVEEYEKAGFVQESYSAFLRSVKRIGMSLKKVFVRDNETANVKEARIWFYVEFSVIFEKGYFRVLFSTGARSGNRSSSKKHRVQLGSDGFPRKVSLQSLTPFDYFRSPSSGVVSVH